MLYGDFGVHRRFLGYTFQYPSILDKFIKKNTILRVKKPIFCIVWCTCGGVVFFGWGWGIRGGGIGCLARISRDWRLQQGWQTSLSGPTRNHRRFVSRKKLYKFYTLNLWIFCVDKVAHYKIGKLNSQLLL